jgi:hypothetical protein
MEKPTKEEFGAYVMVQMSGVTNMFDVTNVIDYAEQLCEVELTKDKCLYIMKNYAELKEEYK